jgi:DNA-binding CsgD family transcriptional regulator
MVATIDLPAFSETLHRLYSITDAAEFPRKLMELTSGLLRSTHISFDQINLATGEVLNVFDREIPMDHKEFMVRWRTHCHEHPGIAYLQKGGAATVFKITDFMSQRQFRQTGLYREIFQPMDATHQLGVILPVPGWVIGMAVNRDRDFTVEECELMAMLHPHIVQAFQNAQLVTSLRGRPVVRDHTPWRRHGFTRRECDVLQWLIAGKRNTEIATILSISRHTVKTHVERILARLGAETRTAAAELARRLLGER